MGRRTLTYESWLAMRQRCRDEKRPAYRLYGGRGIKVCERWDSSFANFLADMGERQRGTSLDRIDNDRGYEPGNCRWATRSEQALNRRQPKLTREAVEQILERLASGESQASIANDVGVNPSHVSRINSGFAWPLAGAQRQKAR